MLDKSNELVERFLRYIQIPSQSKANGGKEVPSTPEQWDMVRLLKEECEKLGLVDLHISEHCVLTGKLPARVPEGSTKKIPALGFCSHVDTVDVNLSPQVHPRVVKSYDGKDIVLNEAQSIVMKVSEHPELLDYVGQDLVVTDGTSVLGADNKSALANIMTALSTLAEDTSIYHGDIYIAFVPDEEVGLFGSKNLEYDRFPVDFAYTIDSCALGELVYETFNAGSAFVTIQGVSAHPMSAKGVMVNPTLLAVDFVNMFNRQETPECTEGKEGYIWCQAIKSNQSNAVVELNIRDHDKTKYEAKKALIVENIKKLQQQEPRAKITYEMSDTYGNIADAITEDNKKAIQYLEQAMKNLGITPKIIAMRGGTDGSYISTQGILTPNYFTGALNFHSPYEFMPVPSFQKSYEMTMTLIDMVYRGE